MRRSSRKPRLNQEAQQVLEVGVERLQRRLVAQASQHLLARRHQRSGAAGGHVHAPQQLLARRLGGRGEAGGVLRRRLGEPRFGRGAQPRRVRAEVLGEEAVQLRPPRRVQLARRREQLARHRRARSFAALGQQRLGQALRPLQRRQLRHRGGRFRRPVGLRCRPPSAAEPGALQDRTPEAVHPGLRAAGRRRFGLRRRPFHARAHVPVQTARAGGYRRGRPLRDHPSRSTGGGMSEAAGSITVRVPLAIRRRPGRKTVVTPVRKGGEAALRHARRSGAGEGAGAGVPVPAPAGRGTLRLDQRDGRRGADRPRLPRPRSCS